MHTHPGYINDDGRGKKASCVLGVLMMVLLMMIGSQEAGASDLKRVIRVFNSIRHILNHDQFIEFARLTLRRTSAIRQGEYHEVFFLSPEDQQELGLALGMENTGDDILIFLLDPEESGNPAGTPMEGEAGPVQSGYCPLPGPGDSFVRPQWLRSQSRPGDRLGYRYSQRHFDTSASWYTPATLTMFRDKLVSARFKLKDKGKGKVRFRTGGEKNEELFVTVSKWFRLSPAMVVEISLNFGRVLFADFESLIDRSREFPAHLAAYDRLTDEEKWQLVQSFLTELEASLDPDNPQGSPFVGKVLGRGISSLVLSPAHFLNSAVLKRMFVTCETREDAEKVITGARAQLLLMNDFEFPYVPTSYLYVINPKLEKPYVIYALQPRCDARRLSDAMLSEVNADRTVKHHVINQIIQFLLQCDQCNKGQLSSGYMGAPGFIFAVDANFPNFYEGPDGELLIADMSPFFWAYGGVFAEANSYAMDLQGGLYNALKTICTNPLRRYIFFLTMIYRQWQKYETVKEQMKKVERQDHRLFSMAKNWAENFHYAFNIVYSLPHVRAEISQLPVPPSLFRPWEYPSITLTDEQRKSIAQHRMKHLSNPKINVSREFYERALTRLQPRQEFEEQGPNVRSELYDLISEYARQIDLRKREKEQRKRSKVSPSVALEHQSQLKNRPMNDAEFSDFLAVSLGLNYHPCPRNHFCFWEALVMLLKMKGLFTNMTRGQLIQYLQALVAKMRAVRPLNFVQGQADPENWGSMDDIAYLIYGLAQEHQIELPVMVIHPNEDMQPVAIWFQMMDGATQLVIHTEVITDVGTIFSLAHQGGMMILANHMTGTYEESPDQHWAAISSSAEEFDAGSSLQEERLPTEEPSPKRMRSEPILAAGYDQPDRLVHHFELRFNVFLTEHVRRLPWQTRFPYLNRLLQEILAAMEANLNSSSTSREQLAEQLKWHLPADMQEPGVECQWGDFHCLHNYIVALMNWFAEHHGELSIVPHTVVIIQPSSQSTLTDRALSLWVFERSQSGRLKRRLILRASAKLIRRYLGSPGVICLFTNTQVMPSGSYIYLWQQKSAPDWWLVNNRLDALPVSQVLRSARLTLDEDFDGFPADETVSSESDGERVNERAEGETHDPGDNTQAIVLEKPESHLTDDENDFEENRSNLETERIDADCSTCGFEGANKSGHTGLYYLNELVDQPVKAWELPLIFRFAVDEARKAFY